MYRVHLCTTYDVTVYDVTAYDVTAYDVTVLTVRDLNCSSNIGLPSLFLTSNI